MIRRCLLACTAVAAMLVLPQTVSTAEARSLVDTYGHRACARAAYREAIRRMPILMRPNRPGMHGYRSPRRGLYGRQLIEKQRLAFYYNVRDRQMRRYVALAQNCS